MLLLLLAGFVLSLAGSLPPGLISLLVAHTAMRQGVRAAAWVALGAGIVEFGQAWVAAVSAAWFLAHPMWIAWFQWAAIPFFVAAGLYLLLVPPKVSDTEAGDLPMVHALRYLLRGGMVSLFNLLALPYWFAYCAWLRVGNWWPDNSSSVFVFSTGVALGTVSALGLYIWAARKMVEHSVSIALYANRAMGCILLALAGKTLFDILRNV